MTHKFSLSDMLTQSEMHTIHEMVKSARSDPELELEIGFKQIDYSNYVRIAKELVNITDEKNIESTDSLDAIILLSDGNSYRVSFKTQDIINEFIAKCTNKREQISQTDIQRYLLGLKSSDNIEIMLKNKSQAKMLHIDDLNIVFKLTSEISVTSKNKPTLNGSEKMIFRLKQRNSFSPHKKTRIDITDVKQSNSIWNLTSRNSNYEIELEVIDRKSITVEELESATYSMLKIVLDTDMPCGKKESENVITSYQNLLSIKHGVHLEKRSTISVEAHHIVKFIPIKYVVTDKADGVRHFLISISEGVYLISTNLIVTKLDMVIDQIQYHGMILDGELVKNENGTMFLIFDVVYAKGIDYRNSTSFTIVNRINVINDIVAKVFNTLIPFPDFMSEHTDLDLNKISKFYLAQLKTYWEKFKKLLSKNSKLFITRKLYFVPYGFEQCEIFTYSDLIWKSNVYEGLPPYQTDGIIYTPINSAYMIRATKDGMDTVPLEYKWKPPNQNSIDFYIRFEKNPNGTEIVYYDEPTKKGSGRPYKVATLHVGSTSGLVEKPIPFKINGIEQKAYIYLSDGEARDIEQRIIEDETVVEFIFDLGLSAETSATTATDIVQTLQAIDFAYKWIPLKTRYDKTESVHKHNKLYGNPLFIANRIWRSIINPITESTIVLLSKPISFKKEMDRLQKLVDTTFMTTNFVYYQKRTDHGKSMRAFHNWIKSNMINIYCKNKSSVLDIGCGRGGDLNKFVKVGINEYVGLDIDNNGLYTINDSAYNRYMKLKKSDPKVMPMYFINADAKGLFNVESQEKILNMNDKNKNLIRTHLSGKKKYDVINCQFTIHYYLSDEISWRNFCKNINDHIASNGYLLITAFDGTILREKLAKKQKIQISYTDNNGNKSTFAEVVKMFDDADKSNFGLAIDLYNSTISNPGVYITEFLAEPSFLIKSLDDNCGLELIETDTFFNLFNIYKKYFTNSSPTNSKQDKIISTYYKSLNPEFLNLFGTEEIEINKASFLFSSLNRYYVFKRKISVDVAEPARIVGINNRIHLDKIITPYFHSNNMIIDPANKSPRINNVYSAIKKMYGGTKPNVYLIRHSLLEATIDNDTYRQNLIELIKLKEGSNADSDKKILLIYKSPDKFFYPIYRQVSAPNSEQYLFSTDKIIEDLDILTNLTTKLNSQLKKNK